MGEAVRFSRSPHQESLIEKTTQRKEEKCIVKDQSSTETVKHAQEVKEKEPVDNEDHRLHCCDAGYRRS